MNAQDSTQPVGIRILNTLGAGLSRLGWRVPGLEAEKLTRAACRHTGLDDFGGDHFRKGLERLLWSLEQEAHLSTLGRLTARTTLLGYLRDRLQIQNHRKLHPDIAAGEISRPLVIVGLPRTGTTILFNLLAQDPANRAPLAWETDIPYPPPETASYRSDPRIAKCQKRFDSLYRLAPALLAIHEMGSELPQECVAITAHEFMSVQFFTMYDVPSYQDWLDRQSYVPALQFHRRFLQHLQHRHAGERWVLKTPGHLATLSELFEVYPDACIIHTHRDPLRVMPSLASLCYALRGISSDRVLPEAVGRQQVRLWAGHLERALTARDELTSNQDQFFDAHFEDVVRDPIGLIERIYDHFDLSLSDEARGRMRAFLGANPRGKRGSHHYTLEDFGLTPNDGRRFEAYRERFSIAAETAP